MKQLNQHNIRYFLYARKSSEGEDRQVQSIDDQVDRLTKLAKTSGWVIKEILTEAHSAKLPNARPIFNSMIKRIERGEANGILCWQINRLSRNPVDSAKVQWLLQKGVIQSIQTIDGERKTSDNVVLLSIETSVANQFIVDHTKNVTRGLESKLAKGWIPCQPPLGYLNDPVTRTIIPDPERFQLIRRLWELVLTRQYSSKDILHMTADWGLVTRKSKHRGGKALGQSGYYDLLSNPFYCGVIRYAGNDYQGKHTPIVSVQEFDQVQAIMGRPKLVRYKAHQFSYRGIFRCGECGCLLVGDRKRKFIKSTGKYNEYTYYRCTKRKPTIQCTQKGCLREEVINQQVISVLEKYTISDNFFKAAKTEILSRITNETEISQSKLRSAQDALDKVDKQIGNLTGMRYRELIDDEQYLQEKEILDREKVRHGLIAQQYSNSKDSDYQQILSVLTYSSLARNMFINGSMDVRRDIVLGLCSNPTALNKKINIKAAEWLEPLGSFQSSSSLDSERIEPTENPLNKVQESPTGYYIPLLWTVVDVIRTALADVGKYHYIPDLSKYKNTPPSASTLS